MLILNSRKKSKAVKVYYKLVWKHKDLALKEIKPHTATLFYFYWVTPWLFISLLTFHLFVSTCDLNNVMYVTG